MRPKNILAGREPHSDTPLLIQPVFIVGIVITSLFAFAAFITLLGYAGDFRKNSNRGAHGYSTSAIGYAAFGELVKSQGWIVDYSRSQNMVNTRSRQTLQIISFTDIPRNKSLDEFNFNYPTLLILPKWNVTTMPEKQGWVRQSQGAKFVDLDALSKALAPIIGETNIERKLAAVYKASISGPIDAGSEETVSFDKLQFISGEKINRVWSLDGNPILVNVEGLSLYILSDPDFINTMGLNTRGRARLAQDLIISIMDMEQLNQRRIVFDLTLHGFGSKQNIVKLMTQPPFLASTLCLIAAGFLMVWQAFVRFGTPTPKEQTYTLGKLSLVDNGAHIIEIAGRQTRMAIPVRDVYYRQFKKGFSRSSLTHIDISHMIDRQSQRKNIDNRWPGIEAQLMHTPSSAALLKAAQDLFDFKQELLK